jgi:hypothetical protein
MGLHSRHFDAAPDVASGQDQTINHQKGYIPMRSTRFRLVLGLTGWSVIASLALTDAYAQTAPNPPTWTFGMAPKQGPIGSNGLPTFVPTYYLTAASAGGLGLATVPIRTDSNSVGANETFVIVPMGPTGSHLYAIRTHSGNYVTAVNGGGMGGPNGPSSPLHTNATTANVWEKFQLKGAGTRFSAGCPGWQSGWPLCETVSVLTPDGVHSLSAVNGGGMGEAANAYPIHTDATKAGVWETFYISGPGY